MANDLAGGTIGLPENEDTAGRHAATAGSAVVVRPPARIGPDAASVSTWFDTMVAIEAPALDDSLAAERDAAEAYARMAKAENTRRAYRAAVRAGVPGARSGTSHPSPAPAPTSPPSWPVSAAAASPPRP